MFGGSVHRRSGSASSLVFNVSAFFVCYVKMFRFFKARMLYLVIE